MNMLRNDSPLQYVRGVGPRRADAFRTLGLRTVGELLEHFPFRYEEQLGDVEIAELEPGMIATVRGEVQHLRRNYPNFSAEISDGSGDCRLRWFNQPFGGKGLRIGATVIATGKVQIFNDELELVQPSVQVFESDAQLRDARPGSRRFGVYAGNANIKSVSIRRAVQNVLDAPQLPVDEFLPAALLRKHKLPRRDEAVRQMHTPDDDTALESARQRLAYEEFLVMETALALRRRKSLSMQAGVRLHVTAEIDGRIRARFPFELTTSQEKVIAEIARDVSSGRPMTRLLQGDVGSGKTVVALYACLLAVANKRQSAIMAPTEILAAQHFANIEKYLEGSRVRRVLLRGGMPRGERAKALAAIEAGQIDLVVGTQALLEGDVAFADLALVVIDEQHKFGVMQRAGIRTKGGAPHYLVMTATPIPRTLAMTVFGDLDVSIIDASPPGRGKIVTKIVTARQWTTVMQYVRKRLEAGEQAFVVCPLIGVETGGQPPPAAISGERGADAQTGAQSTDARYRRRLPHIQTEDRPYFVTFCTLDRWVLPESVRDAVLAHCLHDHGTKIEALAAIVMPDHVHLIFSPGRKADGSVCSLPEILQSLKGASSHTVNRLLGRKGSVWQEESFDRIVRTSESLNEKIDYVLSNPVRTGLVERPEQYPWQWHGGMPLRAAASPAGRGLRPREWQPGAAALHSPHSTALRSARETQQRLTSGPWEGLRVGLLHGAMKSAEKDAVLAAFAKGELHAVVSTTVVEVGVDVPNATIMVVEHAERFGLSQLHQLRGRVGRGSRDSLCVLIAYGSAARGVDARAIPSDRGKLRAAAGDAPRGKAAERLAVLAETTDGFKIAEADLRQRGPGELLGTRQHGLPELRIGRLVEDFELLELARRDAFDLVAADPKLRKPENAALLPQLHKMFGQKLALIDAG
jgi:ATP-dependent DNA helicase RecG